MIARKTRRNLEFIELSDVLTEVRQLRDHGYTRLGKWSLGQCCNHLSIAINLSLDGFPLRLPRPASTVAKWIFFRTNWGARLLANLRVPTFPSLAQNVPIDDESGVERCGAFRPSIVQPRCNVSAESRVGPTYEGAMVAVSPLPCGAPSGIFASNCLVRSLLRRRSTCGCVTLHMKRSRRFFSTILYHSFQHVNRPTFIRGRSRCSESPRKQ